jgi:hypothetical protein
VQEREGGAGGAGSLRQVHHGVRGQRTLEGGRLEFVIEQVRHRYRQCPQELRHAGAAELAKLAAQVRQRDELAEGVRVDAGRRDLVDLGQEARKRAHALCEKRPACGIARRAALQAVG